MNEWGFAGEIKSWWDAMVAAEPSLGLGRVTIEESPEGLHARADLTLRDTADRPLLIIELRLPDHPDSDPLAMDNIANAMMKAMSAGARWSATSDAHFFRLLDHRNFAVPLLERAVPVSPLTTFATRASLDVVSQRQSIREAWEDLLRRLAPVLTDRQTAPKVAPDEFFIESLRASLARPFAEIRDALDARRASDAAFQESLIVWMVGEQGWTHDANAFHTEVERVARVVTYVFVTRLLFYGALRRARANLPQIELPASGDPTSSHIALEGLFTHAREATGDYATVFVTDDVSRWALISAGAGRAWIRVLQVLEHFALESLGFDVLGRLFERLIDPEERYEWGQHYTSPDVVDLMLSAALPTGDGAVMDPASGGGTFLVRAYARKKAFVPKLEHNDRLAEIVGFDVSAFAASVSTINLASQDLSSDANYPQVAASSFFRVTPERPFITLPDAGNHEQARLVPPLTAVVCNPPYIRFDLIGDARLTEANASYRIDAPHRSQLRHRFNYHLFFWYHAARFLAPQGRMAFITSGEWYDSDYGVQLQSWLLDNFHVELVLESMAEPWFSEARVGTVVLVARKLQSGEDPSDLPVRFVTLRQPLSTLYATDTSDDTLRLLAVDALRDRLMSLTGSAEGNDLDHVVVSQGTLVGEGSNDEGVYVGAAWRSRYLRSPGYARTLIGRDNFVELGEIATAKLGAKTGSDGFFFAKAVPGASGAKQRIQGLKGWEGDLDRSNLALALQNPRDLDHGNGRRFVVPRRGLPSRYLAPSPRTRDSGLAQYIAYAELHRVHEQRLVRDNASTQWFRSKRELITSRWALPYNSAYDYFAADNAIGAILNGRFVGVDAKADVDADLLGAVLNSTFSLMSRLLVGVATGNEGAYDVGPPAARMLRVPDPRKFTSEGGARVKLVLDEIREADRLLPAPSATGAVDPLRRKLDQTILEALGVSPGEAAVVLDRAYASYSRWRRSVESVEDAVQENRRAVGARGGNRGGNPVSRLAGTVFDEIGDDTAIRIDVDLFSRIVIEYVDAERPSDETQSALLPVTEVRLRGSEEAIDLGSEERVALVRTLRTLGWAGILPIPRDVEVCRRVSMQFESQLEATLAQARRRSTGKIDEAQVDQVVAAVRSRWASRELERYRNALPDGPATAPNLIRPSGLVPPLPATESTA